MVAEVVFALWMTACGLKPLPPLGCDYNDEAICICDEDECHWVWICRQN